MISKMLKISPVLLFNYDVYMMIHKYFHFAEVHLSNYYKDQGFIKISDHRINVLYISKIQRKTIKEHNLRYFFFYDFHCDYITEFDYSSFSLRLFCFSLYFCSLIDLFHLS